MKQFKIFLGLITFSVLALFSCKYPDIPKHIDIRGKLQLDYAPYLNKTEDLHPHAAIGLQNKYIDVQSKIEDPKYNEKYMLLFIGKNRHGKDKKIILYRMHVSIT